MFLRNILQWYTLAENEVKATKAEKELLEAKSKIIIPSFPVNLYTPDQVEVLNHKLEFSYYCPASNFLWGLSDDFFKTIPSDIILNNGVDDFDGPDGYGFTHLDYNNNSNNISEDEEQNYKKFYIYTLCVKPSTNNFIRVCLHSIKDGTLCYKDINNFLTSYTNFGKTFRS